MELFIILVLPVLVYCEMTKEAKDQIMKLHNDHRSKLGASNMFKLNWDDELAGKSEEWANRCVYEHKGRGENLAWNKPATPLPTDELISTAFTDGYNEKNQHSYGSGNCGRSMSCHYTQLAWHNTTKIGCAYKTCPYLTNAAQGAWWIVCNYAPWGNNMGEKVFEMGPACSHDDCKGMTCEEGLCVASVGCEDENTKCAEWANEDECTKNPSYMLDKCRKSCKQC